jgi:RNA polymerase sigma-70 factor (ECF subfamily)
MQRVATGIINFEPQSEGTQDGDFRESVRRDRRLMTTTSTSLLERLRQLNEQAAWERFVELYTPLLYYWARRLGLQPADAADLVQDVFAVLVQKLPEFAPDRSKSFRGWLRTVTLNKWREKKRRRPDPADLATDTGLDDLVSPDDPEAFTETEYQQHVARRALQLMQREFPRTTWQACWDVVVSGRAPAEVAAQLGISVAAVYTAKSRVLRRLRQELDGLLD